MTWLYHTYYCPRCMKPLKVTVVGDRYVIECPYCGYREEFIVKYTVAETN